MEKVTIDQYGRKSWNVEAYANDSKKPKKSDPLALPNNDKLSYLQQREKLLKDLLAAVKTYNLINPLNSLASHGNNKRFGFFCPLCNVSFRDNLALIEHLNTPQHVAKVSTNDGKDEELEKLDGGISRASTQQVIATINSLVATLIRNKSQQGSENISFRERVARREKFEEKKRMRRRERRKMVKGSNKADEIVDTDDEGSKPMTEMMGFSGFGSTKV